MPTEIRYEKITFHEAFQRNLHHGGVERVDADGIRRAYHEPSQTYWAVPAMSEREPVSRRGVGINWRDAGGNQRGFTIIAGQAHIGHLVELILANCGTDIAIASGAREKVLHRVDEQETSGAF